MTRARDWLARLLDGELEPGVRPLASRRTTGAIVARAAAAGWRPFVVELPAAADRDAIVDAVYRAVGAPGWAGRNWDAMEEVLGDLSWAPARGYVLVVHAGPDGRRRAGGAWAVAADVLAAAAAGWATRGVPFHVLVRTSPAPATTPGGAGGTMGG